MFFSLWFCATQQITETTKNVNFAAQITENTSTSIIRKLHNKFLQIENSQYIPIQMHSVHSNTNTICPFRCYTQQKQQKNPIVPNQKSHSSHSSTSLQTIQNSANCQHAISHSYIFHITPSLADNTPFFTTK